MNWEVFVLYIICINVISILITMYDKFMAVRGGRRVPERVLILMSIIGGSVGMFIIMKVIRHKTKKLKFMIGIPLIFAAQTALIIWLQMI